MKTLTYIAFAFAAFLMLPSCSEAQNRGEKKFEVKTVELSNGQTKTTDVHKASEYIEKNNLAQYEVATFAGGCFWCTEASFERIKGVKDVISGYSGGSSEYPTYREVSYKKTKHAEAIQIYYDPAEITFAKLLEIFFVAHDPTTYHQQGPDIGPQYRSAIFYHDATQKEMSENYIEKLNDSGKFPNVIVTEVNKYKEFWVAEEYHQDYYEINPGNPYVMTVSKPKVDKVMKTFKDILKEKYK